MPMTSPEPPAQPPPPPASPPTVSAGSRTVPPPPPHAPAAADLTAGGRAASDAAQTGAAVTGTAAHRGAWLEPTATSMQPQTHPSPQPACPPGPKVIAFSDARTAVLANPVRRWVARIIDLAFVNALTAVVLLAFSLIGAAIGRANSSEAVEGMLMAQAGRLGGYLLAFLLVITLLWTYELIMVAVWGATVGKMLMRIRVVRAAEGTRPGFGRSFLRWLIPGLCAYVPFVGGFGTLLCYLTLFIDTKRRQGLHDKAASTVVISTADR